MKQVLLELRQMGLKEGDELDPPLISKAIKNLGFLDDRTNQKYRRAVLESEFIRTEQEFQEVKRVKVDWDELKQRAKAENWSHEKGNAYARASMRDRLSESDWALIDPKDIIIEKVPVGRVKYFIIKFP